MVLRRIFSVLTAAVLSAASVSAQESGIRRQVLFDVDSEDTARAVSCYRIPSITAAPDGSLIAAIDERVPSCGDLKWNRDINIVVRRSHDNGKTWTQNVIESGLPKAEWPTEPAAVPLGNGRILVIARTESSENSTARAQFQIESRDAGKTWTRARTNIGDVSLSTPSLILDPETGLLSNYYYHRILARHFIPNPDNLPQVDHIDRNKTNNSIENLRWVSSSDNNRNRTMRPYGRYEYLNTAPNDLIEITQYNDFEYPANKYFFCGENDRVIMRINDHKWLLLAQTSQNGYLRINMKDINGRNHQICMHKLIRHFRNEPQNDENV